MQNNMNTLELIRDFNQTLAELNTLREKVFNQCIEKLLETRTWVWSGGYTPTFNDGDPCNHYNNTHVSNWHEEPEVPDEDEPLYTEDKPVINLTDSEYTLVTFINENYEHIYGSGSYRIWKLVDNEVIVKDYIYYGY